MTDHSEAIYLDHNASTPILPEVLDAMAPFLTGNYGNPSSPHAYGRFMRSAVEGAREKLAQLIDCDPQEIYFTSGGTEANNLAIRGVAMADADRRHIVTSAIEHPATIGPCDFLRKQGYRADRVAVDETGTVKLSEFDTCISQATLLVTVAHANSETGTLQPVREIAGMAHAAGALMHTDAAQSTGKISVSTRQLNVDLLSVAGHKLYAPTGIGALFVRHGTAIKPLLLGAGHERGLRPGTENVASIVGLGKASDIARSSLQEESLRVRELCDRLWNRLRAMIPDIALNGHPSNRLPNTLNIRFPGVSGRALLAGCPGIAASTGSACHAAGEAASAVILAMGVPTDKALGSVRFSLGRGNHQTDIDFAADNLASAWRRLRQQNGAS